MITSRHPSSGQNQNIRIDSESFETVTEFNYLGTTLTNQNECHDEIMNRLNSGYVYIIQSIIFCLPFSYKKLKN
jgi:hypothetical protein